ncbi:MAG: hypothetical protein AAFV85_02345 [Cyanobacteria bacterium J06634_6]
MRRLLLILLATAPLTGCQWLSAGEDVAIIDPFEGAGETIAEAGEDISEAIDGQQEKPFEEPVVAAPTVTADLILSTDPDARTRQVTQSRIDPFATLPIPLEPTPVVVPAGSNNAATRAANTASGANGGGSAAAAAAAGAKPASGPTPPPVNVRNNSPALTRPSPIAALPRIPQPVIAPAISVSGIIQLGGEPYAIVSSSGEPERYVKVGDRLAGGSVRVKRIDTLAFEPQVILEENGIEVSRPIGGSGAEDSADTPAGAAPSNDPTEAPFVPPTEAPLVPVAALPVPAVPSSEASGLPAISLPAPTSQQPSAGTVPGSLLLQPAELTSQVTLPNMRVSVPGSHA